MRARRGWRLVATGLFAVWLGCGQRSENRSAPSAGEREGRSDILRGLMSSRERPPEVGALSGSGGGTVTLPSEPLGQGGSGRPEPTEQLEGHVAWVGDNELLVRDAAGVEHDVGVDDATLLYMKGKPVGRLREFHEGDEVRVTYGEGPGGLVAHLVDGTPGAGPVPPRGEDVQGQRDPGAR